LGILDTSEALKMAKDKNLDLVEIAPKVQPPVCKIVDFGKYQYAQEKKERKQKAKQRKSELKEVRIGFSTSAHDLETKAGQAGKFLKQGHKVKIELRLRGREKAHKDLAQEKIKMFLGMFSFAFRVEEEIKKSPRGLSIVICSANQKNQ